MGNSLNKKIRDYRQAQHATGDKLLALAAKVRTKERQGLFLDLVKGAVTVVATVAAGRAGGFISAATLNSLPEEEKENCAKEIREAQEQLQDLSCKTKALARAINSNVHKNHHIHFKKDTDKISKDSYRKYNKRVRSAVDALNVTLDAVQLSRSLDVAGEVMEDTNLNKLKKWLIFEKVITDILVNVVRGWRGESVSAKLKEIGKTLKQSA